MQSHTHSVGQRLLEAAASTFIQTVKHALSIALSLCVCFALLLVAWRREAGAEAGAGATQGIH